MSAVDEAMERLDFSLAIGEAHAKRLGLLLRLGHDEQGRPLIIVDNHARALLAHALRDASDAAGDVGVEQLDQRWCGIVALLHHAGEQVWTVSNHAKAGEVATLLARLRERVVQLRHRRTSDAVRVRLG